MLETMVVVDVAVGRRMLVVRVDSISRRSRVILQEQMIHGISGVFRHLSRSCVPRKDIIWAEKRTPSYWLHIHVE